MITKSVISASREFLTVQPADRGSSTPESGFREAGY
jgi:hypothetical protein